MTNADITLYTGADFTLALTVTDSTGSAVDLTNSTITSQIRLSSTSPVLATFSTELTNPTAGQATLSLTHAQTLALPVSGGASLHHDALLIQGSYRTLLYSGNVNVVGAITQVS